MIKCIWFWKLLKQFFIISLISCFILLVGSSVKARTYYPTWTGANDYLSWLAFQPVWDREYLMNYGLLVDEDWDFDTFYNSWYSQLVMYYPPYSGGYTDWWRWTHIYGWIDWKLYYYWDYDWPYNWPFVRQWFIKNFMHTTKDLLLDVNNWPYARWENNLTADEFYSQSHNFSNIYTMSTNGSVNALVSNMFRTFCLEESNWVDVYCWSCSATWTIYDCNSQVENSLNYTINDFNDVFDIPYDFSPFGSSTNTWNIFTWDEYITVWLTWDDYINYFENNPLYNFDRNICYVWTNDLTTTWISWIPYYEWTWKNIVQLFANLYWNTFTTKDLWTFLNTWIINYNTWYKYSNRDELDNPLYNAIYSLSSGFYLDYSDNLTNPFINSLTAIYFMASTITDYWKQSTLWEEISTYCYYKLQSENSNVFDWISITDNHDSSIDNNVWNFKRNWEKYSFTYSWENIQAMSWEWTDVDYFSWDDDLDFNNFFSQAFNRFRDSFSISNQDLWAGSLPTYIIMFLMAIVLFRFISH